MEIIDEDTIEAYGLENYLVGEYMGYISSRGMSSRKDAIKDVLEKVRSGEISKDDALALMDFGSLSKDDASNAGDGKCHSCRMFEPYWDGSGRGHCIRHNDMSELLSSSGSCNEYASW